jgi:hypothetical protein
MGVDRPGQEHGVQGGAVGHGDAAGRGSPGGPAGVSTARRLLPGAVVAVAALLLVSMGGAVVAAPVTVPALVWVARGCAGGLRAAAVVVAALTAAELGWALVYLVAGEAEPVIWLVPLVTGLATGWAAAHRPAASG